MKRYCIIVAGGSGQRMGSVLPKQFLSMEGKPLLMHTIEQFCSYDNSIEIILVLPSEYHSLWKDLVSEYSFSTGHSIVAGGQERFHSVKAGLALVPEGSLVAIHDGVRPLVSHDTIRRCYNDAEEFGNAVPFIIPTDSVRVTDDDNSHPVSRNVVRLIQTPQVFCSDIIKKAYEREFDPSFTDDATVAEAAGVKIHLTRGNRENIKITTPEDLVAAQALAGILHQ